LRLLLLEKLLQSLHLGLGFFFLLSAFNTIQQPDGKAPRGNMIYIIV